MSKHIMHALQGCVMQGTALPNTGSQQIHSTSVQLGVLMQHARLLHGQFGSACIATHKDGGVDDGPLLKLSCRYSVQSYNASATSLT
jgi:hypothetical protein